MGLNQICDCGQKDEENEFSYGIGFWSIGVTSDKTEVNEFK